MKKCFGILVGSAFLSLFLSACGAPHYYAPVTDASVSIQPQSSLQKQKSAVSSQERISRRYREAAKSQQYLKLESAVTIQKPSTHLVPERIDSKYFTKERASHSLQRSRFQDDTTLAATTPKQRKEQYPFLGKWHWPANGKIVQTFSAINKGVDIKGQLHNAIFAAESGQVIYCGNGLPGYGNLIILKHNNVYLSAYAHAESTLVKEGEWVRAGQVIAKMGKTGTDSVKLHFEIRRSGKPVNPLLYL